MAMKGTLRGLGVLWLVVSGSAFATESKCAGNRVERGGSTQYTVRSSGETISIVRMGDTQGRAVKQAQGHAIEVGGDTVATLQDGHIYRGETRWASVNEAQRVYDCPEPIAATLWVLERTGR
ncbi:hypothetical protein [Melittangium boletus]|uniref:Lipoprotein n=1 Tax=Melittangium boletus DSM 14713 TaxID=1294270 RepID=A0A250ICF4_9BACT|nr:hypothetical protein [Melittangium boletus]ATB29529.1 hypothetical protein MEBOL_002979 [Melittangium boletus DSM 14713]